MIRRQAVELAHELTAQLVELRVAGLLVGRRLAQPVALFRLRLGRVIAAAPEALAQAGDHGGIVAGGQDGSSARSREAVQPGP